MYSRTVCLIVSCAFALGITASGAAQENNDGGIKLGLPDHQSTPLVVPKTVPDQQSTPLVVPNRTVSNGRHAALAWSPATGRYGYGYNYGTREGAEREALRQCGAADARIVTWTRNGYIAVARGNGTAIGWGTSQNAQTAVDLAHYYCLQRSSRSVIVALVNR